MKYIIFLYLLFEFINSKELKYRFGIPKALIRNYNTIIKESEETEVCQAETKAQCIAIKNPSEDAICCFSQIKMAGITIIQACSDFPKELLSFSDLFETKEFKAYLREEYGYQIYSQGQEMPEVSTEIKVTCKDGQFSMALFEKAYSDKENTLKGFARFIYTDDKNKSGLHSPMAEYRPELSSVIWDIALKKLYQKAAV